MSKARGKLKFVGGLEQALVVYFVLSFDAVCLVDGTVIQKITDVHLDLSGGIFPAKWTDIQNKIDQRTGDTSRCGMQDFNLSKYQIPNRASNEHTISVLYGWFNVSDDIRKEVRDKVATSFKYVLLVVPFLPVGCKDAVAHYNLFYFTDSDKPVFAQLLENNIIYVDQIDLLPNGEMRMVKGQDHLFIQVVGGETCVKDYQELADFRDIEDSLTVTYPADMDWSICDRVGWNVSFCEHLRGHRCALSRSGNDFCFAKRKSLGRKHCSVSMTITEITKYFENFFPIAVNQRAIEAETVEIQTELNIKYPCLSN